MNVVLSRLFVMMFFKYLAIWYINRRLRAWADGG